VDTTQSNKENALKYIDQTFQQRFSAREKEFILNEIIQDEEVFNALINRILDKDAAFNIGPSWILGYAGICKPEWFLNRLNELLETLDTETHPSVYRAIARVLRYIPIPENYVGIVIDICLKWLQDPKQTIAVKAFSMHALSKLFSKVPEICPEIRFIIESIIPYSSPGLKNAGQKIIRKIELMGY